MVKPSILVVPTVAGGVPTPYRYGAGSGPEPRSASATRARARDDARANGGLVRASLQERPLDAPTPGMRFPLDMKPGEPFVADHTASHPVEGWRAEAPGGYVFPTGSDCVGVGRAIVLDRADPGGGE